MVQRAFKRDRLQRKRLRLYLHNGLTRRVVTLIFLSCITSLSFAEEWDDILGSSSITAVETDSEIEFQSTFKDRTDNNQFQTSKQDRQRLQVVNRLDQEILVLRAEMAKEHGDIRRVHQYLKELENQRILPIYLGRIEMLKRFVAYNSDVFQPVDQQIYVQQLDFSVKDREAVIAIVLPVTGEYGTAGRAIQKAIQDGLDEVGFKGQLLAVDSANFYSADEIWKALSSYQPNLVFGPLEKSMIEQWKLLATGTKSVFFNSSGHLGVGQYSLSPNRLAGLEQIFQLLQHSDYQNVLVLRDSAIVARQLEESFYQAWLSLYDRDGYNLKVIEGNVGKAIDDSFDISGSKSRKRNIQRIIATPLDFTPRRRQDYDAVISFVPQKLAIQVAPYLNFLTAKNEITHVWYPSKTPSATYLKFNRDALQQTYVILPQSIEIDPSNRESQINSGNGQGLFYALGRVAVELITQPQLSNEVDTLKETDYGSVVRDASGQFHLLPVIYWADNGRFSYYLEE